MTRSGTLHEIEGELNSFSLAVSIALNEKTFVKHVLGYRTLDIDV